MTQKNDLFFGEEQNKTTFREQVSKYLSKWPIFVFSLLVCIGAGFIYTRYASPKYYVTTTFLVKKEDNSTPKSEDLIKSVIDSKVQTNLSDEILQLGSRNLLERTIAKSGFNITYYKKNRIQTVDIYKDAPFRLLTTKQLTDANHSYTLNIEGLNATGGKIVSNPDHPEKKISFEWDKAFNVGKQTFTLEPNGSAVTDKGTYLVTWEPVPVAAAKLSGAITIKTAGEQSDAIQLTLKANNLNEGQDILNSLFAEFDLSDIEDRNKLSETTVKFIDERLASISRELNGVEGNLEDYQGSNELVDVKDQSSMSLENSNTFNKSLNQIGVQQKIVSIIRKYIADPANSNKLVPASLDLEDPTLKVLITEYNEVQLKKQREAPMLAPSSTVMQDFNTQIATLKNNLFESLANLDKNLKLQARSYQGQNSQNRSFLSAVPHNTRVLQGIKRKQGITESLYTYLLQKREEAAISSTSSSQSHYKQIDKATSTGIVEPNKQNIMIYSTLLGLFLALGWIYISELLNDKILDRQQIQKKVSLSIVGDINHVSKRKRASLIVTERNVVAEQLRAIRTHLSFLLNDNQKVILVTSSLSNEGKSFVSLNLAGAFAMPGKKVALLEFDMRKPVLSKRLTVGNDVGLSDYLTGKENDFSRISHELSELATLHIYPSGSLPINPSDLLLNGKTVQLFEELKAYYDYVIIDSPPVKLVSDAFILGRYSDLVLYVIRQHYTEKKQLDFINEIVANNALRNVNIVFNDIETERNKSNEKYYGYATATT